MSAFASLKGYDLLFMPFLLLLRVHGQYSNSVVGINSVSKPVWNETEYGESWHELFLISRCFMRTAWPDSSSQWQQEIDCSLHNVLELTPL